MKELKTNIHDDTNGLDDDGGEGQDCRFFVLQGGVGSGCFCGAETIAFGNRTRSQPRSRG